MSSEPACNVASAMSRSASLLCKLFTSGYHTQVPIQAIFSVVPCGHISCQACLIEWFTSPPPGAEPAGPLHRQAKRKTCPHCRGAVRSRPVEVFGLGPVVAALVNQSGALSIAASTSKAEAPVTGPADPWAGLFPPPSAGHALRDEADGVLRCPACFHEIWDGECVRCGRMFSEDGSGRSAFGSDVDSISIYGDGAASVFGEGDGSMSGGSLSDGGSNNGEGNSVYGSGHDYPHQAIVPRARVYDSYDEDEDEDDSFIDDTELPRPPPAAYFTHYAQSDSDGQEEEPEAAGYQSARGGEGYRSPLPDVIRISSSSSDLDSEDNNEDMDNSDLDDEEEDDFLPPRGRRGRSAETEITSPLTGIETAEEADDEDDNDEADTNVTIEQDDEEEEDDEAPIRPVGSGRRAAAAGWGWNVEQRGVARGRGLRRIESQELDIGSESGSEYFSE
jgi:hypothetical protein